VSLDFGILGDPGTTTLWLETLPNRSVPAAAPLACPGPALPFATAAHVGEIRSGRG
jgi:hypothetical protein